MQSEYISEISGHVAQEGQLRRSGIAENHIHVELSQNFVGDFSDGAQICYSKRRLESARKRDLYHFSRAPVVQSAVFKLLLTAIATGTRKADLNSWGSYPTAMPLKPNNVTSSWNRRGNQP